MESWKGTVKGTSNKRQFFEREGKAWGIAMMVVAALMAIAGVLMVIESRLPRVREAGPWASEFNAFGVMMAGPTLGDGFNAFSVSGPKASEYEVIDTQGAACVDRSWFLRPCRA